MGTNRYVSALSKLAPSPDWFSGFHDFNAINEKRNTWYTRFEIPVYPYDAGTEDGTIYEIPNGQERASVPIKVIKQFTMTNILDSKVFVNQDETNILPVGTYSCMLSDEDGMILPKSMTHQNITEKEEKTALIIGLCVGIIGLLMIGVVVYFRKCRKTTTTSTKESTTETSNPTIEIMDGNKDLTESQEII